MRSLAKAFTEPSVDQFGVVLRADGGKVALRRPEKPVYVVKPDGLYWTCRHAEGQYELLASERVGYELVTPSADPGQVETVQRGFY